MWEKERKKKVHYNLKNRPTLLADKLRHPQNRAGGKGVVGNFLQLVSCFRPEPTTHLACVGVALPFSVLLHIVRPFFFVHAMFGMTLAEEWYALRSVLFSSRLDFVDHDMGSTNFFDWLGSSDHGAAFLPRGCV